MVDQRLSRLIRAAQDPKVTARYWRKISKSPETSCWLWTGAVSGKGHGRFWIGRDLVVIASRFGWIINAGPDISSVPEVVGHSCDNPLCQAPAHLEAITWSQNRIEYLQRVGSPGSALRDRRGSRRRALALRAAALNGTSISEAEADGLTELDKHQAALF